MSERIVALTPVGKNPNIKKDCTEMINSAPTTGQAATKNSLVNPSGPDTLSFGRACSAEMISSAETGATSPAAEPSEHR